MLRSIHSQAASPNFGSFIELERRENESNLEWLQRARVHRSASGMTELLLLGGKSAVAFRLRVAQSQVRADITPSHWSHIALLSGVWDSPADEALFEISLEPREGFGYPPPTNGVQASRMDRYSSAERFPNIAWIELGVEAARVHDAVERFMRNRSAFDSLELVLAWLAFVWGVGSAGNPLISGIGIPAAAMIETVVGAADYELTPGLASRSSCPEAVWQTVRWWQSYYEQSKMRPPLGCWTASHFLVDEYDAYARAPIADAPRVARRRRASKK